MYVVDDSWHSPLVSGLVPACRVTQNRIRGGTEAASWIRRRHGIILSSRRGWNCETRATPGNSGSAGGFRTRAICGARLSRAAGAEQGVSIMSTFVLTELASDLW